MASPMKLRTGIHPGLVPASNPRIAALRSRVKKIPQEPGVYRWLNDVGDIIYVGKAKNLRQRLRSYLTPTPRVEHYRKRALLENMADLEVTYTSTEMEALILEMHLIRSIKPRYNVSLTRDSHYVFVRIGTHELFPSVQLVHHKQTDGALYLGPYTNPWTQQRTLELLRRIYRFRTCSMGINLRNKTLFDEPTPLTIPLDLTLTHKDRRAPCLDYHIRMCSGPCTGDITPQDYYADCIENVISFYRGTTKPVLETLLKRLQQAVGEKKFERAAEMRDMLSYLEQMTMQSKMFDPNAKSIDALGIATGLPMGAVLQMRGGSIVNEERIALSGLSENVAALTAEILPQYYANPDDIPDTILVPALPEDDELIRTWLSTTAKKHVTLTVPRKGEWKRLLTLAQTNARRKAETQSELSAQELTV